MGRQLVDQLVRNGSRVTVFDLVVDEKDSFFTSRNVTVIKGDLSNKETVTNALKGIDCVFHVAAPDPLSPNRALMERVNVTGTKNVISACKENKVTSLVFTSSASVIADGSDHHGVDDKHPYPKKFRDVYSETKATAEQMVVAAGRAARNAGSDAEAAGELITAAIRPHGIFGPGDRLLITSLVANAKKGSGKLVIGDGTNKVDFTFVKNVVHAHLLAAQAAHRRNRTISGETFLITNEEPVAMWDFFAFLLDGLGYQPGYICLPYKPIYALSFLIQGVASLVAALRGKPTPVLNFSPNRMNLVGTVHYYSSRRARELLGYEPIWTLHEAIWITLREFAALRNPSHAVSLNTRVDGYERTLDYFTAEDVRPHNRKGDAWLIVDGGVFDVTEFVDEHQGGDSILKNAGADASAGFHGPQHPAKVAEDIEQFRIGYLTTNPALSRKPYKP